MECFKELPESLFLHYNGKLFHSLAAESKKKPLSSRFCIDCLSFNGIVNYILGAY